jgi:hypothetical protein
MIRRTTSPTVYMIDFNDQLEKNKNNVQDIYILQICTLGRFFVYGPMKNLYH